MTIKRNLVKQSIVWYTIISMCIDAVRLLQQPLTNKGWINYIAKEIEIGIENSTIIFEALVTEGVLIFTRMMANKAIYINDRTPEFKRYMWFDDVTS